MAMQGQFQDTEAPRQRGLLPSHGIEWSLIWLAVGILGMVFLLFAIISPRSETQPTYDRNSQIAPRELREPSRQEQPEIGSSGGADPA
jgi:hypothetical protein